MPAVLFILGWFVPVTRFNRTLWNGKASRVPSRFNRLPRWKTFTVADLGQGTDQGIVTGFIF